MGTPVVEPGPAPALPVVFPRWRGILANPLFHILLFFPSLNAFLFWLTYICLDLLLSSFLLILSFSSAKAKALESDTPGFGPQPHCYLQLKYLKKNPLTCSGLIFLSVKWASTCYVGAVSTHRNFSVCLLWSFLRPQGLETNLAHSRVSIHICLLK